MRNVVVVLVFIVVVRVVAAVVASGLVTVPGFVPLLLALEPRILTIWSCVLLGVLALVDLLLCMRVCSSGYVI